MSSKADLTKGRPSVIHDYCLNVDHEAIWICTRHGNQIYAVDENINSGKVLDYISKQTVWNKYISFCPATEPRLIKASFPGIGRLHAPNISLDSFHRWQKVS